MAENIGDSAILDIEDINNNDDSFGDFTESKPTSSSDMGINDDTAAIITTTTVQPSNGINHNNNHNKLVDDDLLMDFSHVDSATSASSTTHPEMNGSPLDSTTSHNNGATTTSMMPQQHTDAIDKNSDWIQQKQHDPDVAIIVSHGSETTNVDTAMDVNRSEINDVVPHNEISDDTFTDEQDGDCDNDDEGHVMKQDGSFVIEQPHPVSSPLQPFTTNVLPLDNPPQPPPAEWESHNSHVVDDGPVAISNGTNEQETDDIQNPQVEVLKTDTSSSLSFLEEEKKDASPSAKQHDNHNIHHEIADSAPATAGNVVVDSNDDDDDFGDFDSATPNQPSVVPTDERSNHASTAADAGPSSSSNVASDNDSYVEDFGNSNQSNGQNHKHDDVMGDEEGPRPDSETMMNGNWDTTGTPSTPSNGVVVSNNGDDDDEVDDDFGDFDEAIIDNGGDSNDEIPNSTAADDPGKVVDNDDDDFGDFDAAPIPDGNIANTNHDALDVDDDDDFGDFDEAVVEPNDAHVAATEVAVVADTVPSSSSSAELHHHPNIDPLLHKIRSIFPRIYARYALDGDNDVTSIPDQAAEESSLLNSTSPPSIQAILSELETNHIAHEEDVKSMQQQQDWAQSLLDHLFQDDSMYQKAESRCVVPERGKEPVAYLNYPVGGIHSKRRPVVVAQPKQRRTNVDIPESAPPMQSSLFNGSHSTRTDETSSRPTTTAAAATVAVASVDTRVGKVRAGGSDGTISEQARKFLQRIPDLSYMLSSKLSLPTNNNK